MPLSCILLACKPASRELDGPYLAGSVYAIVDNQYFEGIDNSGIVGDSSLSLSAGGTPDSSGPLTIRFNIGKFKGAGRYPIDAATSAGIMRQSAAYEARSGYVEVSSASEGHITGTFAFLAYKDSEAKQVSAGRFELYP